MNIIVVDDEPIVLSSESKMIEHILPTATVSSFREAQDAIEYAEKTQVDVAVLDVHLEGADGLVLSKKLQRLNPRVNVVFCTGYSEYAMDAARMFCSGYLLKPVSEDKLKKSFDNLRYPLPAV